MSDQPARMDVSIMVSTGRPWDEYLRIAQEVDRLGGHAVYVPDHFMANTQDRSISDESRLEATGVLAALAMATERCRLGALVLGGSYRHPAVVASSVATLDQVSRGRAIAGLGAGWQVNEHRAYGIDLMSVADRSDRFEESVHVISSMLRNNRTTVDGTYFNLTDAPRPATVQDRVPVLVAGGGERRTLRTVATYADVWHVWASPEDFAAKAAVLDQRCAEVGRDPGEIRRATGQFVSDLSGLPDLMAPYPDVCAEFVIGDVGAPVDELLDALRTVMH